jgi:opacity protein-like surface antigen
MTIIKLLALAALAVISTSPAAAADPRQPTGKWCQIESGPNNVAPDIWREYKRGDCKAANNEDGWIVFFPGGYRERKTTCKITNTRRGKNWLLYHCTIEGGTEDRIHKWSTTFHGTELSWGTLEDQGED